MVVNRGRWKEHPSQRHAQLLVISDDVTQFEARRRSIFSHTINLFLHFLLVFRVTGALVVNGRVDTHVVFQDEVFACQLFRVRFILVFFRVLSTPSA